MLLMIFVNDLGTLRNIPGWLEHTKRMEDGMGLADTVFPAFLFIVGLSIPFAIHSRIAKGIPRGKTAVHILTRSLALLVMGFFHVNLENYNSDAAILPKPIWEIALTVAFFLIWLDYAPGLKKARKWILQGSGILLLVVLGILFRGGEEGPVVWLEPYWWGILGLIGWAYLLSALIYLYSKDGLSILAGALVFFTLFNIADNAGWLHFLDGLRPYVWIVGSGSMPALTTAGVLAAVLYRSGVAQGKVRRTLAILFALAILMLAGGFALRPFWGISKIRATPSWVMICTGISLLLFMLLIAIVDIKKREHWFSIIKPAGTSTLTCYLLPYIHYSLVAIFAVHLPIVLRTGIVGIIKSILYALAIILVTGLLEKRRLRLKI